MEHRNRDNVQFRIQIHGKFNSHDIQTYPIYIDHDDFHDIWLLHVHNLTDSYNSVTPFRIIYIILWSHICAIQKLHPARWNNTSYSAWFNVPFYLHHRPSIYHWIYIDIPGWWNTAEQMKGLIIDDDNKVFYIYIEYVIR